MKGKPKQNEIWNTVLFPYSLYAFIQTKCEMYCRSYTDSLKGVSEHDHTKKKKKGCELKSKK